MTDTQIVIIGGGSAGLAAAIAAHENGCEDILILEREKNLGGILNQCIHNGFGLHMFKEELTGPEYAQKFIEKVLEYNIPYQCETTVLDISTDKIITAVGPKNGIRKIQAKSIILAMGCRERPRGAIGIPGFRGAGIYTAGTAQKFVNIDGLLPGKKIVILGSGDIGLITARRMTFMGAEVLACVEIMPYSSGLKRNIVQCLDDFNIPLLLNHTVVDIQGKERVSAVVISEVDPATKIPIKGTEKKIDCDTLLLSVGLIPENELTRSANIDLYSGTNGAYVDETLQTSVEGIFACGNVLHVHDLVDYVSEEAYEAGKNAALYVKENLSTSYKKMAIKSGEGISAIVPQYINLDTNKTEITVMFRPNTIYRDAVVCAYVGNKNVLKKKKKVLVPGEMVSVNLDSKVLKNLKEETLEFRIEA